MKIIKWTLLFFVLATAFIPRRHAEDTWDLSQPIEFALEHQKSETII
ncbi:MAG: hypothetical protein FWF59_01005 [Turicibacter sp.]|nr:hypothetical protein [Turicibacter sp.]